MIDINEVMYNQGKMDAIKIQKNAPRLTGTQLYESADSIPDFVSSIRVKNMLERKIGFVCKSSAGRMVRLLQSYDSNIYPQEPEDLPAQWGFAWSKNPKDALPFIQVATSPYNKGDCCSWNNKIYCSTMDGNVYSPIDYPLGWEEVIK